MENSQKQKILIVCGPTASGKSDVGILLAKEYNGEVISADSMQIYVGLDIATAKPTVEEMQGVPHHMISVVKRCEKYSVAAYLESARKIIADIHIRGKLPIVVGGTGLYISSLVDNITFDEEENDGTVRRKLNDLAKEIGNEKMLEKLHCIDPETANNLHANNLNRIIRALEVYEITGKTLSEQKTLSRRNPSPYDCLMFGIDFEDREYLYERINRRVDIMMAQGLLDEAKNAYDNDDLGVTSAQAIGVKELIPYFDGTSDLISCVDKIKQETRRYAKRQLTWFRRDDRINWILCDENTNSKNKLEKFKKIIAKNNFL